MRQLLLHISQLSRSTPTRTPHAAGAAQGRPASGESSKTASPNPPPLLPITSPCILCRICTPSDTPSRISCACVRPALSHSRVATKPLWPQCMHTSGSSVTHCPHTHLYSPSSLHVGDSSCVSSNRTCCACCACMPGGEPPGGRRNGISGDMLSQVPVGMVPLLESW